MGETLRIEVYSDVVCPWCYIGKRHLDDALATLGTVEDFPGADVVLRPFQLDPRARRGRSEPVLDVYSRKFGGLDRAQRLIEHVTSVARAEGLDLHLELAQRANTADAHRLLWWTLRTAGAAAQNDLNEALMAAYFCGGEDLGDHDVLVACAARCGLDDVAARHALDDEEGLEALAVGLEQAAALGITAVPTFVVNSRWSIPGAQDVKYFVDVLGRMATE